MAENQRRTWTPRIDSATLFQGILERDSRDPRRMCKIFNPRNYNRSPAEKAAASSDAIDRAERALRQFNSDPTAVFPIACDGSIFNQGTSPSPGGYAVVIPDREQILSARNSAANSFNSQSRNLGFNRENPIKWTASAVGLEKLYESDNPELQALAEGLRIAKHNRLAGSAYSPWSTAPELYIPIICDSQNGLDLVQKGQALGSQSLRKSVVQPIVTEIITLIAELKALNCRIEFIWIPGHDNKLAPHEMADNAARSIAYQTKSTRKGSEYISSTLKGDPELGIPDYVLYGRTLQDRVLEVARRHPDIDNNGRALSREFLRNNDPTRAAGARRERAEQATILRQMRVTSLTPSPSPGSLSWRER